MKALARAVPIVLLLAVAGFAVRWLWAAYGSPPVVQPIQYNHKVHLENNLTCDNCHEALGTPSPHAGRPAIAVCETCHSPDSPVSKSPEEAKLLDYIKKGEEPPWQRVHRLPDYVYFSHYRHATLEKIDCKECHGDMAKRTTPLERPVHALTMKWCIACHQKSKAPTDCDSCHK